jgi:hypothetical protein
MQALRSKDRRLARQWKVRPVPVEAAGLLQVKKVYLFDARGQYEGVTGKKVKKRRGARLLCTKNDRVGQKSIPCRCKPARNDTCLSRPKVLAREPMPDG